MGAGETGGGLPWQGTLIPLFLLPHPQGRSIQQGEDRPVFYIDKIQAEIPTIKATIGYINIGIISIKENTNFEFHFLEYMPMV
jgi:hypothetical protein